ncbi:CTP synthase [bacterium]|nr:CTP synthase [bacterium]MBQ6435983.1 CTP synthase [bacterium]
MKYIFVSGGVLSGLGKGVTAASLGVTLKARGYKVTNIKFENYLNLDAGNINPIEHGDVFLCEDGTEADLDLGTYERFLGQEVSLKNYCTVGQIYQTMIQKTCDLEFKGKTVDAIPYIPEEIIDRIKTAAKGYDIILIELGGCAGEYQNAIYYEANRILKLQEPGDVVHVHVTYFPKPEHINELKSKPTQLSVKNLNSMGIQPDFIVGRAEIAIDDKRKDKVAYYCNLAAEDIISNPDCHSIYELPLIFEKQYFASKVLKKLGLKDKKADLAAWQKMVDKIDNPTGPSVKIAIIAKYLTSGEYEVKDSYASLLEAIDHAVTHEGVKLDLRFIKAEDLEKGKKQALKDLHEVQGIIVPIGWGNRGVEGKIMAIQYAREHKIPYLGLCYGMQLALIEFARHVVGLKGAHTTEVNPKTPYPVVHEIPQDEKRQRIKGAGASMRLGAYDAVIKPGTLIDEIYRRHHAYKNAAQHIVSERHRHRFEVNNAYRKQLAAKGLVFAGTSPDDFFVEFIELPRTMHPFFIATQGHPEYKTRPLRPHPFFVELIKAAQKCQPVAD